MTKTGISDDNKGRVYGGENQEERRARRRQQFLVAGLQVFGTLGYRAATVRTLCKQAELTDRYFYESFDTTEDLLMGVYHQQCDALELSVMQALARAVGAGDLMQGVEAGLDAVFTHVSDSRVARVIWVEVMGVSPRVDKMYNDTMDRFANLVMTVARQRYPDLGIDSEDEIRMLGLAIAGAVSQCVLHWLLGGYRESRATMVSATSRVFRGLLSTLPAG